MNKGELVCIEGPVGGGKSSFLMAIMAGMKLNDGTVSLKDVDDGRYLTVKFRFYFVGLC